RTLLEKIPLSNTNTRWPTLFTRQIISVSANAGIAGVRKTRKYKIFRNFLVSTSQTSCVIKHELF
ncbi:MAG: hypothetical protein CML26_00930, partial [Rhizobiales bacterium]|nr:hypothetical protein [Hyphomicrobiales bacterium]